MQSFSKQVIAFENRVTAGNIFDLGNVSNASGNVRRHSSTTVSHEVKAILNHAPDKLCPWSANQQSKFAIIYGTCVHYYIPICYLHILTLLQDLSATCNALWGPCTPILHSNSHNNICLHQQLQDFKTRFVLLGRLRISSIEYLQWANLTVPPALRGNRVIC